MEVQLYIEGERVELFSDESILLNSSVQNIKDITKVFTDYSQTFQVPASNRNNKLFKHWYKAELDNPVNANVRRSSEIHLNFNPYKIGRAQLNKATKKNGVIESYSITFYGNIVKMTDLFGDDLLTDLDLSAYEHAYTDTNVKAGLEGTTLLSGDVIYPLITYERPWQFGVGGEFDIQYNTGDGLSWWELKPAIKLQSIIDAIETEYGITFSTDFFNTTDFNKLFFNASRSKGLMESNGLFSDLTYTNDGGSTSVTTFNLPQSTSGSIAMVITPEVGYEDVVYTVAHVVNNLSVQTVHAGVSNFYDEKAPFTTELDIRFEIRSTRTFKFKSTVTRIVNLSEDDPYILDETSNIKETNGHIFFTDRVIDNTLNRGQLPKMKVIDFINGLIKMFNLIFEPINSTSFHVDTLDSWYDDGEVKDFSKYIDLESETINRSLIYRILEFEYEKPSTIMQDAFFESVSEYYGDLIYDSGYDGNTFTITLPFENLMGIRMQDASNGEITNVRIGWSLDDNFEPVDTKPMIFYKQGINDAGNVLGNAIGFIEESGFKSPIGDYNDVGQENNLDSSSITRSLNWGSELSTSTHGEVTHSLFADYWETYISNLYSTKIRLFEFSGTIPFVHLSKLRLNDKLIINNRRYIINSYRANLLTGKVNFILLNDLVAQPLAGEAAAGLEYPLDFGLED